MYELFPFRFDLCPVVRSADAGRTAGMQEYHFFSLLYAAFLTISTRPAKAFPV